MNWAVDYSPDVRLALHELDYKGSMPAVDFGIYLVVAHGFTAEQAVKILHDAKRAGLIWIGGPVPRRGQPDYVALTGNGRRCMSEFKLREGASSFDSAAQRTLPQQTAVRRLA